MKLKYLLNFLLVSLLLFSLFLSTSADKDHYRYYEDYVPITLMIRSEINSLKSQNDMLYTITTDDNIIKVTEFTDESYNHSSFLVIYSMFNEIQLILLDNTSYSNIVAFDYYHNNYYIINHKNQSTNVLELFTIDQNSNRILRNGTIDFGSTYIKITGFSIINDNFYISANSSLFLLNFPNSSYNPIQFPQSTSNQTLSIIGKTHNETVWISTEVEFDRNYTRRSNIIDENAKLIHYDIQKENVLEQYIVGGELLFMPTLLFDNFLWYEDHFDSNVQETVYQKVIPCELKNNSPTGDNLSGSLVYTSIALITLVLFVNWSKSRKEWLKYGS